MLLLQYFLSIMNAKDGGVFLRVLFICSECSLFVKTGGLADVLYSLPRSLSNDVECSIVLPYYKIIKDKNIAEYIGEKYFNFGKSDIYCGVYKIRKDNINYFFIDNNEFFYHEKLYGFNDGVRFTFFNMAVIECLDLIGNFDVFHLNDWHTGLIPFLLKYKYFIDIKTVYTIHNIQYQGIFSKDICELFHVYNDTLEFDNNINFMKSGIVNSSIVTTVSPSYKEETLSYLYSYNLENILLSRYNDYYGIINGIDVDLYNPATDELIYKKYSDYKNKLFNKEFFCKENNLNNNMLCSLISRLCDQKGIELISNSIDEIMANTNVNLFLMGSGDSHYENKLNYYANLYPNRIKVYIGYNEQLAQRVYASSDLLFVPSKFEPCGLSQLIAMRYATLPLVRECGGLKDTVTPFNQFDNSGTGFTFKDFNTSSFKSVFYLAYNTYQNSNLWSIIATNAMSKNFSFNTSAKEYLKLYYK